MVLFLEYIPQNLDAWLTSQLAAGPDAVTAACAMVQRCLHADIAFMNANGLLHFDAHFRNVLTDGHRLYLADLGLATSPRFDLSTDERDFLALNASHDACYAVRELLNWTVAKIVGIAAPDTGGPVERYDYIRRCAKGARPAGAPEPVAELISRYAPVVAIMNDFYWNLFGETRATPYPAQEIAEAMTLIPGFAPDPPASQPANSHLQRESGALRLTTDVEQQAVDSHQRQDQQDGWPGETTRHDNET